MIKLDKPDPNYPLLEEDPKGWVTSLLKEGEGILSLYYAGRSPSKFLKSPPFAVEDFTKGQRAHLSSHPDALYDGVIINHLLECLSPYTAQLFISECKRVTKNGGFVVAVSSFANDYKEIMELADRVGLDCSAALQCRLSNDMVDFLKPTGRVFFKDDHSFKSRKDLRDFMRDNLFIEETSLEHLWGVPEEFKFTTYQVGMCWKVDR